MSKRTASLRGVAVVALAVATLSLPMMSAAHAQTDTHRAGHRHMRIYNTTRDPSTVRGWSDPPMQSSPRAPAANEINSTWPEGMPTYSGGNGP